LRVLLILVVLLAGCTRTVPPPVVTPPVIPPPVVADGYLEYLQEKYPGAQAHEGYYYRNGNPSILPNLFQRSREAIQQAYPDVEIRDIRSFVMVDFLEPDCFPSGGRPAGFIDSFGKCAWGSALSMPVIQVSKANVGILEHELYHAYMQGTPELKVKVCPNSRREVFACVGHSDEQAARFGIVGTPNPYFPDAENVCNQCDPLR